MNSIGICYIDTCDSVERPKYVDEHSEQTLVVVTKSNYSPEGLLEMVTMNVIDICLFSFSSSSKIWSSSSSLKLKWGLLWQRRTKNKCSLGFITTEQNKEQMVDSPRSKNKTNYISKWHLQFMQMCFRVVIFICWCKYVLVLQYLFVGL